MDATDVLVRSKVGYVSQNIKEGLFFNVGVADSGMTGIKAVGTHNLVDLLKGKALVGGRIIFLESMTSTGLAAMRIQVNGADVTATLELASMAAGEVVDFNLTSGKSVYAVAADMTLDMVVEVAALTAGRFVIQLDVIDIVAATTRG